MVNDDPPPQPPPLVRPRDPYEEHLRLVALLVRILAGRLRVSMIGKPDHMTDVNATLDVQIPSTAITEFAKGMSDLRDALQAMAELTERGCSTSELEPYFRQAWSGVAAVSVVAALIDTMEWADETCPGIPEQ
jgi:hypothetical protein